MPKRRPPRPDSDREHLDELADEAKAENPDPVTRRETFELELMEEGRSEEGESVSLDDEDEDSKTDG
jgi:hypothetical protein